MNAQKPSADVNDDHPYHSPRSDLGGGDHQNPSPGWRIGRQLAGWGLLALGLAGLVLPVLPGWVFIGWGAVTLAPDIPFFARVLERIAHKVPQLQPTIDRLTGKTPEKQAQDRPTV
ncbi:MAG TPA: hypothetical protein VJ783_23330 [Pirellulales bacterium]|nr:hypothetical protein [Pirellulales bacterium]